MKKIIVLILLAGWGRLPAEPAWQFEDYFIDQTLRIDYDHTGTALQDIYAFDEAYLEPYWAGSRTHLIDTLDLGAYLFTVQDHPTRTLLYSRGFCSIFGEWRTTEEARTRSRSFSESLRFPMPKREVRITIHARDRNNRFQEVWSLDLDPSAPEIIRTDFFRDVTVRTLMHHGPSDKKVDLLILPDGYTGHEIKKFIGDAKRMTRILFDTSPFREHKTDFNVRVIEAPSADSGIDDPAKGVYRDNILSSSFNSFGSDRYILSYDNKTIRKLASRAPYDFLYILVNSEKYGGGGIFNLYATCIPDNLWSDYIFVHEFGHLFAGLGDEYYTSDVAYAEFYPRDVEPWEPNITALLDPDALKWKSLVDPDTPIPTPWDKSVFDSANAAYQRQRLEIPAGSRRDSLGLAHQRWIHEFNRTRPYWGRVGAFEGSGYASEGLYRPSIDCRMFSRSQTGFDPVCTRAIIRVIRFYTGSR
ncbi:MAG TPA: peptidase M64 [bacterium]|nr:peptidase M64 [bacterium]